MAVVESAIQIALQRAERLGEDLAALADRYRGSAPAENANPRQRKERAEFLRQVLPADEAQDAFERIMGGNELQDINYLSRGARAAMAVARLRSPTPDGRARQYGTGFMIAPGLILTNNHVIASAEAAAQSQADFNYQLDDRGEPFQESVFTLAPGRFFFTDKALDFTVCAVEPQASGGKQQVLSFFGELPLVSTLGKVIECEWMTIVQHPDGKRKMVCVRDNQLLKRADEVLWYSSDTLGGSSGSPVFNNDWFVVALHHSGVPERKNGKIQTRSGRDFDPAIDGESDIKWVANEGIRASRIVERLKEVFPDHPMLQPLYNATPQSARVAASVPRSEARPASAVPPAPLTQTPQALKGLPMSRTIQVTLRIDDNGNATVINSDARESLTIAAPAMEAAKAASIAKHASKAGKVKIKIKFNPNYASPKRKGFDSKFLPGGAAHVIHRPELTKAKQKLAAPLLAAPTSYELDYMGYTVVMNAGRRMAMYSAASVDFEHRSEIDSRTDTWRADDRISDEHQLDDSYYTRHRAGKENKFDKGHLTRNEDMEYGTGAADAAERAMDTFHFTNRVPQHALFNRAGDTGRTTAEGTPIYIWQELERHILEGAIVNGGFRAQVITGPVLADNDPVFKPFGDLAYPEQFWKVAVAVNAKGKLIAVAFLLDQSGIISDDGLEAVDELPFKPFHQYQVKVSEIERLTGLRFYYGNPKRPLSECDPMEGKVFRRGRSAVSRLEAAVAADIPEGYIPIEDPDSLVLE